MNRTAKSETTLPPETVAIRANGEIRRVPRPATVEALLHEMGLGGRRGLAVAIGDQVILRGDWPLRTLDENDRVLVIQATQGG